MTSAAEQILQQYGALLGEEEADVQVLVGPELQAFPAHKLILKARSPYFRALFQSGMRDSGACILRLPEASAHAWQLLLPYIYSGAFADDLLDMPDLRAVGELADFLQLGGEIREHLSKNLQMKKLITTEWRNTVDKGSETSLAWLRSMLNNPVLRDDTEAMLASSAKRDWKTVRMLCIANHFSLASVKTLCLQELSKLFRRGLTDSDTDADAPAPAEGFLVARLDKDFDFGCWKLQGAFADTCMLSAHEAVAAIHRGIASEMLEEPLRGDEQKQLSKMLARLAEHCDELASLCRKPDKTEARWTMALDRGAVWCLGKSDDAVVEEFFDAEEGGDSAASVSSD
eukprot:TRINITY_DN120939_c0_g1_i1.p1 TRINITY_DN120939_c0_g1~~TRINITY_DN120939_c0_g1_i1.p1  ORF type:complete len:343 (+),score=60.19 TRINITY_DN120939_c0_g1_i1:239-1267(+)